MTRAPDFVPPARWGPDRWAAWAAVLAHLRLPASTTPVGLQPPRGLQR